MDRTEITAALFSAVDSVNETLAPDARLTKSDQTVLFGEDGRLDSLGCINLVLAAEEQLLAQHGVLLDLAAVLMGDDAPSPPGTLGALADFIQGLLSRASDG